LRAIGLAPRHVDDTLRATGNTMLKLGLIPKAAFLAPKL
jgi:hypothetical protein